MRAGFLILKRRWTQIASFRAANTEFTRVVITTIYPQIGDVDFDFPVVQISIFTEVVG